MSCIYVMARDIRNLIFLDYKFYMFGGKLYNNPPDLKMEVKKRPL